MSVAAPSHFVQVDPVHIAVSLVGLTVWTVARNLASVSLVALAMAGVVLAVAALSPERWPHIVHLGLQVGIGVTTYALTLQLFGVQAYVDLRELTLERLGRTVHG